MKTASAVLFFLAAAAKIGTTFAIPGKTAPLFHKDSD